MLVGGQNNRKLYLELGDSYYHPNPEQVTLQIVCAGVEIGTLPTLERKVASLENKVEELESTVATTEEVGSAIQSAFSALDSDFENQIESVCEDINNLGTIAVTLKNKISVLETKVELLESLTGELFPINRTGTIDVTEYSQGVTVSMSSGPGGHYIICTLPYQINDYLKYQYVFVFGDMGQARFRYVDQQWIYRGGDFHIFEITNVTGSGVHLQFTLENVASYPTPTVDIYCRGLKAKNVADLEARLAAIETQLGISSTEDASDDEWLTSDTPPDGGGGGGGSDLPDAGGQR
jgi:uncharacterized coiled-coil protein SlyX